MIKRFIQHEPLFIRHFTTIEWPFPVHNHNHYELVFVHSGTGHHEWNGLRKAYEGPQLFLLAPDDFHIFFIAHSTEFSVLKFSKTYLDEETLPQGGIGWGHFLEQAAGPEKSLALRMGQTAPELSLIEQVIRLVVSEWTSADSTAEILRNLIRVIFAALRKIVADDVDARHPGGGSSVMAVIDYIHEHIHQPGLLRIAELAKGFHYSPNYLNQQFREVTGTSIKRYISEHRFFLIQEKLKHSNYTIKEICHEFGFADLSHFNKFVKGIVGKNPSELERNRTDFHK